MCALELFWIGPQQLPSVLRLSDLRWREIPAKEFGFWKLWNETCNHYSGKAPIRKLTAYLGNIMLERVDKYFFLILVQHLLCNISKAASYSWASFLRIAVQVRKVHQRQSLNIRALTCLSAGVEEGLTYENHSSEYKFFSLFYYKMVAFDYIVSLKNGVWPQFNGSSFCFTLWSFAEHFPQCFLASHVPCKPRVTENNRRKEVIFAIVDDRFSD